MKTKKKNRKALINKKQLKKTAKQHEIVRQKETNQTRKMKKTKKRMREQGSQKRKRRRKKEKRDSIKLELNYKWTEF